MARTRFNLILGACILLIGLQVAFCADEENLEADGDHSVQKRAFASYQTKSLQLHNAFRKKHGSPPLKLDANLNAKAVKCAQYYANKGVMDHSCPYKYVGKQKAGENIGGAIKGWSALKSAEHSTKQWYNEVKNYNYRKPGFTLGTGHFTQVVWKGSKRLGVGFAPFKGKGQYGYVVALYDPPGNYPKEFPKNVKSSG